MGFMFRVRLSSFFAGASAASVGGFYYLYKDYMLAQQAISQQCVAMRKTRIEEEKDIKRIKDVFFKSSAEAVRGNYESLEGHYETLNAHVTALENSKALETATPVEGSV